jgi:hypothetical protein
MAAPNGDTTCRLLPLEVTIMISTAPVSSVATSIEDIIDAFRGPIEPVRVPLLYDLGLLLVAVAMVLLPLLYIALIMLAGYGIYFHATESTGIFEGGNARLAALVYFTPIVAGLILIFFMLKPLFARPPPQPLPVSLDPAEEPGVFRFVEKICATVGAPLPRRIDVDCQVNASAGFAAGFRSMFSQDLVLTIGLPLVAGLSLRELAGVLAHEFGHFTQGTGMRLTYIIRSVNNWFARVVYERDAWDEMLIKASTEGAIGLGMALMLNAARFMVWLTRRILWVLMMAGHIISSFMLRQMEFDADRYEARVAGSTAFETTSLKLRLLGLASQGVYSNFQNAWNQADWCSQTMNEFPSRQGNRCCMRVWIRAPNFSTVIPRTGIESRAPNASVQTEYSSWKFRPVNCLLISRQFPGVQHSIFTSCFSATRCPPASCCLPQSCWNARLKWRTTMMR